VLGACGLKVDRTGQNHVPYRVFGTKGNEFWDSANRANFYVRMSATWQHCSTDIPTVCCHVRNAETHTSHCS
jgi:hypothetical protein